MSSKSRNKKGRPQSDAPVPAAPAAAATPASKSGHDDEGLLGEDVIHVPKGKSRLQYAVMIGLLVFLTIIFLVPGAILATFTGPDRGDPEFLAYNAPNGERVILHQSEWQKRRNAFADVFDIGLQEFQFLKYFVGLQGRGLADEEGARLIVLDELARDSGILITDEELAEFLASIQGMDANTWRAVAARYGGPAAIEPGVKAVLGIRRYLDLVTQVARVPDVEQIEKRWAEEHVELAFDYVSVPTADYVEAAKAEAPDAETLEAWFNERTDFEKNQFMDPLRFRTTIAVLRDPAASAALLERFPDTTGETPEARGEAYYNSVFFTRFKRPEPEDGAEEPAEGEDAPTPFLSLEEVRAQAEAEAPGYFAARAWIAEMRSRVDAGEELDFRAEAEGLGLELITIDEPATLEELREHEELGAFVVGPVSATQPGNVAPNPVVEDGGLHVLFVDERVEPTLPPFAEIQDEVVDSWAEERARELAVEALAAVREGFDTFEKDHGEDEPAEDEADHGHRRADEDAFRAACEAAGFEVQRRPWLDKSGPASADPDAQKPGHQFLAQRKAVYGELDEGEVPEPELDRTGAHAFLVRLVGKREMDIARMTPAVYQSYKQASANEPATQARIYLTGEGLDEAYGISWLYEPPGSEDDVEEYIPE